MAFLNDLAKRGERFAPGHRLCPGCGQSIIVRALLNITDYEIVIANATGCLEVCSGLFPYTSWCVPWIHSAFENAASTIAGAEAMYRVWKRKGRTDKDIKFVALASDGGLCSIRDMMTLNYRHDILSSLFFTPFYLSHGCCCGVCTERRGTGSLNTGVFISLVIYTEV